MGRGPASRPRGPQDRKPADAPAYAELDAIRWELPVVVDGVPGVLVIRWFTDEGRFTRGGRSRCDDGEVSARGRAVTRLEKAG